MYVPLIAHYGLFEYSPQVFTQRYETQKTLYMVFYGFINRLWCDHWLGPF